LNQNKLQTISESFIINGVNVTCAREIVEKFNEYFTNIGLHLAACIPTSQTSFKSYHKGQPNKNSLFFNPTTCFEVINIVSKFDQKTRYGVDGIPIHILKATVGSIAEPLSRLINCSLSTGVVPPKWKIGKICPVFKDVDKDSFSNYRPVSVLPSFSKIYEKVVANRLRSYLDSYNISSSAQYGFRRNHSTYMAILDMYDRINSSIDRNDFSIAVFIDL